MVKITNDQSFARLNVIGKSDAGSGIIMGSSNDITNGWEFLTNGKDITGTTNNLDGALLFKEVVNGSYIPNAGFRKGGNMFIGNHEDLSGITSKLFVNQNSTTNFDVVKITNDQSFARLNVIGKNDAGSGLILGTSGDNNNGWEMLALGDNFPSASKFFQIKEVTGGVFTPRITMKPGGNFGIGAVNPTEKLEVAGNIKATGSLISGTTTYPDYVLEEYTEGDSKLNPAYDRKTLQEVDSYIKTNKHLPGITSVKDIKKNEEGKYEVNTSELQMQLLEKVEELYLHTIEQQKQIDALKAELKELKGK